MLCNLESRDESAGGELNQAQHSLRKTCGSGKTQLQTPPKELGTNSDKEAEDTFERSSAREETDRRDFSFSGHL